MMQKSKGLKVLLVIIIIVFAFTQYQENRKYERYLSLDVRNSLSDIVYASILCNNLFKEISQTGEITYEQMESLQYNFGRLVPSAYRLASIAQIHDDKVPMGYINSNLEMLMYINQEFDLVKGDFIALTEDQTKHIRRFEVITGLFIEEMENGIKGIHVPDAKYIKGSYFSEDIDTYPIDLEVWEKYYGDTMVKNKDWQKLLWALDGAIERTYI